MECQIGLEKSPDEYVAKLIEVFRELRKVLKKSGTLWLNIGDSYATGAGKVGNCPGGGQQGENWAGYRGDRGDSPKHKHMSIGPLIQPNRMPLAGLKAKDLVGIPWMVAFALRADGWYLRQDIIWHKPNPMPESVTDRCTKSHEYIFLLSKSERYYYDQDAIKEPIRDSSLARLSQDIENQEGSPRVPGKTNGNMKAVVGGGMDSWHGSSFNTGKTGEVKTTRGFTQKPPKFGGNKQCPDTRLRPGKEWNPTYAGRAIASQGHSGGTNGDGTPRYGLIANKKSVWTVATQPFKGSHYAVFPEKLIEPAILAGCPEGGIVLDPFIGSGTTMKVAIRLRRHCIGIDLGYEDIQKSRTSNIQVELF
jgi:DNA modification methylase